MTLTKKQTKFGVQYEPKKLLKQATSLIFAALIGQGAISSVSAQPDVKYVDRVNRAIKQLDEQLKETPNDTQYLLQRAALNAYLEKHEDAIEDFTAVIKVAPTSVDAYAGRAGEYMALKKFEDALIDANKTVELGKDNRPTYLLLRMLCYYMLGKDKDAIADLDTILAKPEKLSQFDQLTGYADRAELNYRLGKYKEAIEDCDRTIAIDPRGAGGSVYFYKGKSLESQKDAAGAAASLAKAKEIGYVDTGRQIDPYFRVFYSHMFDPVLKEFAHRIDTKHFVFLYNGGDATAQSIAKFSEAFLSQVSKDLAPFKWETPVNVFLTADKAAQYKLLKDQFNIDLVCEGTSIGKRNALVFLMNTGYGTAAHVIYSKIMEHNSNNLEQGSGVGPFFEKVYGYSDPKDDSSLVLWGFQNPWRLKAVASKLPTLKLAEVIEFAKTGDVEHQSEERLLAMFAYDQGKLKKYTDVVASGNLGSYKSALEAAFEKPASELESAWHDYVGSITTNINKLEDTPPSQFFTSEKELSDFAKEHTDLFPNGDYKAHHNI